MTPLFGRDEEVAAWIGERVRVARFCPPYTTIGFMQSGRLTGAALFNGFNGANIEITIAGRGVVRPAAWRAIRSYVFDQIGCRRVTAIVRGRSASVQRMAERFGFRPEARLTSWFDDDDGVMFGMLREDCTW